MDFWKGKKDEEEDDIEDFQDGNYGEDTPDVLSQDRSETSRVLERPGPSPLSRLQLESTTRNELLGNGGPGFLSSSRAQTSRPSGLSALLAARKREPLKRKAFATKTSPFTTSSRESSRSNDNRSSSYMEAVETQEVGYYF